MYSGYWRDAETGNFLARNRFYNTALAMWISRDPIGYAFGDMNLYAYCGNSPTTHTDPLGLSPLDVRVGRIRDLLRAGGEQAAAEEALQLYRNIVAGGQMIEGLAAALMQNWLDGAPKDPYIISSKDVYGAITDSGAAAGSSSPYEQLRSAVCGMNLCGEGTLDNSPFSLTATKGQYYHAFGSFSASFSGRWKSSGGKVTMTGTWSMSDRYDWHSGLTANVGGTVIPDDYALLVEKYYGAKPFNEVGSWFGTLEFDCSSGGSQGSGGTGR